MALYNESLYNSSSYNFFYSVLSLVDAVLPSDSPRSEQGITKEDLISAVDALKHLFTLEVASEILSASDEKVVSLLTERAEEIGLLDETQLEALFSLIDSLSLTDVKSLVVSISKNDFLSFLESLVVDFPVVAFSDRLQFSSWLSLRLKSATAWTDQSAYPASWTDSPHPQSVTWTKPSTSPATWTEETPNSRNLWRD